ncbi:acetyltransferase-like isoleucine patch superfamily enzyme [Variovorax paradoxus]|uniref:Acetyltransferase-like isoleucine patch superfamily enzyme n=1 Tax=Variovorax paradoxus TaxID=34073 RepID=A0AAW8EPY2_VARPD|nr:DapH/DapD/GlmU-related protein [Variovorax paradoxus]MDP9975030.1 acetyltransferase-like isoleucine patch superfamily enzyme [Variovorax paradoxus]
MPGYIGSPKFLVKPSRIHIDKRVRIFPGLRAECHGEGRIVICEDVAIEQDFHITSMGEISIGQGTVIAGYVSVTDIEHQYEEIGVPVMRQPMVMKKTAIGANCFIGMGARIQAGTILGDGCVVGANAVVRGTFPDHSVIVGVPAKIVKQFNKKNQSWERAQDFDGATGQTFLLPAASIYEGSHRAG